jgi:HEPN domain-containing protein
MKENIPDVSIWLQYADGDLHLAKWGMHDENPAYHTICFLCQSSAEKYLKALLLRNNWKLRKTHDVIFLLNEIKDITDIEISELSNEALILNSFKEESRYPGDMDLNVFDSMKAKEAISAAVSIKEFVLKYL